MKCPFCLRNDIKASDANHPYRCAPDRIEKNDIKKMFIDHNYGVIDRDTFIHQYSVLGFSLPDFKREMGLPYTTTQWLCDYYGIDRRSIKEAVGGARKKAKITCLNKFGVENPSQSDEVKLKKKETFLRNYGEVNIFATETFKQNHMSHMQRTYGKGSLSNRFGGLNRWWLHQSIEYHKITAQRLKTGYQSFWNSRSEDEKKEIIKNRETTRLLNDKPRAHYSSKLEDKVAIILEEADITHSRQYWFKQRSYDFRIEDTNVLLEVQGDYWHANPKKYAPDDFIKSKQMFASAIWEYDSKKREMAENAGFIVIYIWESEITNDTTQNMLLLIDRIEAHLE